MFKPGWFIQNKKSGTVYLVLAIDETTSLPTCKLLVSGQEWFIGQIVQITRPASFRRVFVELSNKDSNRRGNNA